MSAIRVLHVVDSLGLGGAQTILKDYFESRAGDENMSLYALRALPRQVDIGHPHVWVNPSSRRFTIAPLLELRRIVRERDIQVLHCHLFRAQVLGFLLKILFRPEIALVFHEHGRAVGQEGESWFEALTFRWFLRLAWRRVNRFICISEHTRARLLQVIPGAASLASVIANPIPIHPRDMESPDRASMRQALGIPEDAFVVGFASRLIERKGWNDFLEAMAILSREAPVHFLLAGDGEDRAKVEARVAELGLQGHGRVMGHIDWMERFYNCLDCFVMPSHWEPHGLAQLEAQSFGVCVVVSNVPGLSATVKNEVNALLFEAGDVQALAECIRRLAANPKLRRQLADEGLINSAHYTMDAFTESLDEIYSSATHARREAVHG